MLFQVRAKREYYDRIDPLVKYTEKKFVQRYRLSKTAVRLLIASYIDWLPSPRLKGKHAVPHRIMFCVALRYLATGANYSPLADCHGISRSSVTRAVKGLTDFFHDKMREYVQWPDQTNEKHAKAVPFTRHKKKPGVFGLVDGTHVPIICPRGSTRDENQYFCYKGYYSINTMIVCDWDGLIIHCNAANPGSCNDIYVMNGSQIKKYGELGDFDGFFLLGDSGYALTDYVLTPVKHEENASDQAYNAWHKSTRSKVERVIGVLKQRWRCLDTSGGYLMHDPKRAGKIIQACACLHNVAKVGQVKLYRDFKMKDSFHRTQPRVEQPVNAVPRDKEVFHNLRKDYITEWFKGRK